MFFCNYYYVHVNPFYDEDYLVFSILYNEKKSKLYDKDWDFSLINYLDIRRGLHRTSTYNKKKHSFNKPVNLKFEFDDNFLEKLYNSASKLSMDWINKCDEVRKESRDWGRLCHQGQNTKLTIDWERQLYHLKCQIFYHRILNGHEDLPSIKELEEMEKLGEESYKEKMRKQSEFMKNLFAEMEKDPKSVFYKGEKK